MKRLTKILICVLAFCMLLPLMASCNEKKPNGMEYQTPPPEETEQTTPSAGGNDDGTGGNDDDDVIKETTTPDPDAGIIKPEKIDMGGYTYKAYVRMFAGDSLDEQLANGNNTYKCIDFWVDEDEREQDAISYAVYSRNSRIEADYNCKIRQVPSSGSQIEHLTNAYASGEGYDLTIISAKPAAQAATRNLLRNIKGMTHIDLSHNSFDQNSINELSVENKLYFLSGDMNISTLEIAGLSLANVELYESLADSIIELYEGDISFANLYSIVFAKKWTVENMMKIATAASIDIDQTDGDLSAIDKGDTVGYFQYLYSTIWYFYSAGGRITKKNDAGVPELTIQSAKSQEIANYLFDHVNSVISVPKVPNSYSAILDQNFLTGQVLFMDCSVFEVRTQIYPFSEFEYGVLPCPLYEEGSDYHSVAFFNNWAHLWAIPSMVANAENAERMMQIMAVYSSLEDSTMHAYYDRTVYLNAAPDNGSRQVMDIIRQSIVYDIALLYDWGGLERMLEQISDASTNPYGAAVSGIEATIQPKIDETIELLRNPLMDS